MPEIASRGAPVWAIVQILSSLVITYFGNCGKVTEIMCDLDFIQYTFSYIYSLRHKFNGELAKRRRHRKIFPNGWLRNSNRCAEVK